jgi:NDP-sugar pyrophosphorylase family protein
MIAGKMSFLPNELPTQQWLDIGRPWDLFTASKRLLSFKTPMPQVQGEIEPGATIRGPVHIEKSARIRSGVYIEGPVYIGRHSDIGPNTYIRPFTNIANDVRIGHACEVKNSIILSETHIGHLSYIGDSIIGFRTAVAENSVSLWEITLKPGSTYKSCRESKLDGMHGSGLALRLQQTCRQGIFFDNQKMVQ